MLLTKRQVDLGISILEGFEVVFAALDGGRTEAAGRASVGLSAGTCRIA